MSNDNRDYTPAALRLDDELMESAKEILSEAGKPISTIPENLFKNYFLPCFAGQEPFQEKLAQWLDIAGGVHNPVQVVDEERKPIFDVPAVYSIDTFAIDGRRDRRSIDVSTLMTTVTRFNTVNPVRAREIMDNGFHQLALEMVNSGISKEVEEQWGKIFDRYGIKSDAQHTPAKSASAPAGEVVDDFDPL
jgi:hypothetical protein